MFEVSGLLFIAPGLRPVSFYKLPKKGEADNQDLKGLGLPKRSVHTHIFVCTNRGAMQDYQLLISI